MRRLTAKIVRSGLVTAWRFAGWPTSRSPSSVKATIDGVVRIPSAFSMTLGDLPSITATQELVVTRSIPMTLAMELILSLSAGRAGPKGALCPTPLIVLDSLKPIDPVDYRAISLGSYRRAVSTRKTGLHAGKVSGLTRNADKRHDYSR